MEYPKRKNLRLKDYDYSTAGAYFITLCTDNRQAVLSDVHRRGGVLLRPLGKIVESELKELKKRYQIEIDSYVIMPDHIHMIIKINCDKRAEQSPAPTKPMKNPTIGDIICTFKSLTTKNANQQDHCPGRKIWQRNYYEHIIRDEEDYIEKRNYIEINPEKQLKQTDFLHGV